MLYEVITPRTGAASACRQVCHVLLDTHGVTPDQIDWFVAPQATAWYADALIEAVGRTLKAYKYDALIVGTTDLTHYGPRYGFIPQGVGPAARSERNDVAVDRASEPGFRYVR